MNIAKTEDIPKLRPFIFAAVRKVVGNQVASDEMEDLVQDVFLELLSGKLAKYDPERGMELSTYVTMVASRHAIDKMRRLREHSSMDELVPIRHEGGGSTTLAERLDAQNAASVSTALERLIEHEHGERLQAVIQKLPKEDQRFLARLMDDDYSTEDHAEELGITVNSVYIKKCRLVAKLRKKLTK